MQADQDRTPRKGWRAWLRTAKRPLRRLAILLVLALIVEYLVIPELVGASKDLYLLGRVNAFWMIAGLILEAASLFCYALLTRALLPPEGRPSLSGLTRIDLSAAAVAMSSRRERSAARGSATSCSPRTASRAPPSA